MKRSEIYRDTANLLLIVILTGVLLVIGRNFLYPILLSVLIAYLLYPVAYRLENWGIPRVLSILTCVLLAVAVFSGIIFLIYKQLSVFLKDLPEIVNQAKLNAMNLELYLEKKLSLEIGKNENWLMNWLVRFFTAGGDFLKDILTATTSSVVKFGIMPVYIFLFLYYRNKFKQFLLKLMPNQNHANLSQVITDISYVTKKYMSGVVIVVLILCVLNTIGLLIVGMQYALLFGILSALMNFIPYFGTLIGGAIPLLFSMLIYDSPSTTIGIIILFLILQFIENNILTPNITGGQVRINPLFTILSIVLGGMIWGLPGMIISVPLLGMFKIVCDYIPKMEPFSYLIGTSGTEQYALNLQNIKAFFRRFKKKS